MTPGAYLRARRTAAGVSILAIAAKVSTDPRWAERDRVVLLYGIEADVTPASRVTLATLRHFYPFSDTIYDQLVSIHHLGMALDPPRICRTCGCSEHDACQVDQSGSRDPRGRLGCRWVEGDLCSACCARDHKGLERAA